MNLPASFRTAATEQRYQEAQKRGNLAPLKDLRGPKFKGMTLAENGFAYDAFFKVSDMLLEHGIDSREFYHKALDLWLDMPFEYGHFIINAPHMQSVPETPHVHLVTLKERDKFKL